jgi:hypothetical protein
MYKGAVYKGQWDEINLQANRAFLPELLDQALASEETSLVGKTLDPAQKQPQHICDRL